MICGLCVCVSETGAGGGESEDDGFLCSKTFPDSILRFGVFNQIQIEIRKKKKDPKSMRTR